MMGVKVKNSEHSVHPLSEGGEGASIYLKRKHYFQKKRLKFQKDNKKEANCISLKKHR